MNLLPLLTPLLVLLQSGAPAAPKMDVRLFAAADSVAPGGKVDLAVEIKLEKDWHIYYPVHLDAGWPTLLTFSFADDSGEKPAATFGPVRFPPPNLGEMFGFEYLAYHDTLVLLTEMTVDPALHPDKPLKLRLKVDGTVCHDQKGCIPAKLYAALDLPLKKGTGQPANAELFSKAAADRMKSLADAQWTSGSTVEVAKVDLKLNEPNELIATIRVKPGHHIQDRDPGVEGLIGTRLLVEPITGVKFDEAIWPAPKIRDVQGIGKVRELGGEFKIRIPFTVNDSKFVAGEVYQRVLLYAQCCTDAGQCYPPEFSEGVIRYKVESPNASADPWFNGHGSWLPRITPDVKNVLAMTAGEIGAPALGSAAQPLQADGARAVAGPVDLGKLLQMILFGMLGGFILNVMPCVLPVISIKILGFVQQAGEDPRRVFRLGLAFCAGIMVWFWLFALMSSFGKVPLQDPRVVIGISAVLFVMALNLFGVFEITLPGSAAGTLDSVAAREGYAGSFFKGLLATLLGTACTAPFLVSALAYTASQPGYVGFIIFTAAGIGMALPYLLLSAQPAWLKYVPRPGQWMVTFKQAMGFVLIGTVIWLFTVLVNQIGGAGVVWTTAFFAFLGLAAWLMGTIKPTWETGTRATVWVAAVGVGVFGWWFSLRYMHDGKREPTIAASNLSIREVVDAVAASDWKDDIPWQAYRPGLAAELSAAGHTVYVDYTADWCLTCKANKKVALDIQSTRDQMRRLSVIPILADYTNEDPAIRKDLLKFGHNNVPMNLVYPANRPADVTVLDTVLLPGAVHAALEKAGPSVGAGEATAAAPSPAGVPSR